MYITFVTGKFDRIILVSRDGMHKILVNLLSQKKFLNCSSTSDMKD